MDEIDLLCEECSTDHKFVEAGMDVDSDFTFNWKTVILHTPNEPYYDEHKIIGCVQPNGDFVINGVHFTEGQYEIIDEDPMKLKKLQEYFDNTPKEVIESDWGKSSDFDNVGPTVDEFLKNNEI